MSIDPRAMEAVHKEDVNRVLEEFFERGGEPKCPAARIGHYADTRNRYLNCKVEDNLRPGQGHFAIGSNPLGVMVFCCDAYVDCPTWQAEQEDDPIKARVAQAFERDRSAALTKRQIESGLRVDDAGLEAAEAAATEDVVSKRLQEDVAEAAAEQARRNAEKRYTKGD